MISINEGYTLGNFHEQIKKLKSNTDFFQNFSYSYELNIPKQEEYKYVDMEEKTIKAFILDFRPFFMTKSKFNIDKICNLIAKNNYFNDKAIEENTKKMRLFWNQLLERKKKDLAFNGLVMKIGDKRIKSEENLKMWLNEEYHHPDNKKMLPQIKNNMFMELLSKSSWLDLLQKLGQLIVWFDNVVILEILKIIVNKYENQRNPKEN